MCRIDCMCNTIECCHERTPFEHNSWSKVLSGPCGRFIVLLFLLSLMLFLAMVVYASIYVIQVLNQPNIICVPSSFIYWCLAMPTTLVLWFLIMLYTIWFKSGKKEVYMDCCEMCVFFITCSCIGIFAGGFFNMLVVGEVAGIIREGNHSDIMFQYFHGYSGNLTAYPIFLRRDDINYIYPNSTCYFVPFSDLCPIFGPLRDIANFPGAFRCLPNGGDGIEPFLLYLGPLLGSFHTAVNLGVAFAIFAVFGCFFLFVRRRLPPHEWIENRCCWSSREEPGEHIRLI